MSRFFRVLSVAALASTSTLAQAQQPATTLPAHPGKFSQFSPGQVQPGKYNPASTTRPSATRQVQPGQVQPGQVQPGQVQPGRPNQVQPGQGQLGQAGMHAQGVSLNAFIAHKLKRVTKPKLNLVKWRSIKPSTTVLKSLLR